MADDNKKKKIVVAAVSSLILVVVGVALVVGISQSKSHDATDAKAENAPVSASMKAIQTICQPTQYKETCISTLEREGANTTDPKELVKLGINATISYIRDAAAKSETLKELAKDPRASQALQNCKELMEFAIDDLNRSVSKLGVLDFSKIDDLLLDLKTWIGASVTYQETCLDGFENTTGDAGEKMREFLKTSSELSTNGLTMVSQVYKILSDLNLPIFNRRLLQDERVLGHDTLPQWIDPVRRRLMGFKRPVKADLVVAQDGSGNFTTINEAINAIPLNSNKTFVLYIKQGIYKEIVTFPKKMINLVVIGDGPTRTVITGDLNFVDGVQTYATATVTVLGDNFMAKHIGFANTAGAIKHQAVALRVKSDWSVFYKCRMDGYQDTLYAHTLRQYYRDCTISGTIDFVFGDAEALFQNCNFVIRRPLDNQACIVTAQGRKTPDHPSAIILQNCTITADKSYLPVKSLIKSYLGRPWKEYSRTIVMYSFIDSVIDPSGWMPWFGTYGLDTLFYSEYQNTGPGSDTTNRVTWKGIKTLTPEQVEEFTPSKFLLGDAWIPRTRTPYYGGLTGLSEGKTSK